MDRAAPPLLPYVAVTAMLMTAILLHQRVGSDEVPPSDVQRLLEQELGARVGAVLEWEKTQEARLEALADEPSLREQVVLSLRGADTPLHGWLASVCAEQGFDGCAILRRDGSMLEAFAAPELPSDVVHSALDGRTAHSRLLVTDAEGRSGSPVDGGRYAVFFATPVLSEGRVHAVLGVRVSLDEALDPLFRGRPLGRTGETYAVDPRGFMLTRSRFGEQAVHPPDAPRVLGASATWIRTPAGTPTRAVTALEHGGTDVVGYLDYRGIRVVGAWRWLDELGAGVVTEMDASEAFHFASR